MIRSLGRVVCFGAVVLAVSLVSPFARAQDAPAVPGLDPALLTVAADDDERARLPLAEALQHLSMRATIPAPAPFPTPEPSAEDRDRAAAHYIRGRDAMAQERYYVAIVEFDRGLKLHPGSAALLRQQARVYGIMGNADRSSEFYERLRAVAPGDPEAHVMFANAQASRGDFTTAAVALAAITDAEGDPLAFDAGAEFVAAQILAFSLPTLGYHQAALNAAETVLNMPERLDGPSIFLARINAIARQREELLRVAGDSCMRLGQTDAALTHYSDAMSLPTADRAALLARLILASTRAGQPELAERAIAGAIANFPTPESVDPWLVAPIGYLRATNQPIDDLREALRARASQHAGAPQFIRLYAATLPREEAVATLRGFLNDHADLPERLVDDVRRDLLARLAEAGIETAVGEAVALVERDPALAGPIERSLFAAVGASAGMIDMLRAMDSFAARLLIVEQQLRLGDLGAAAREVDALREAHPERPAVLSLALSVAGRLGEPARLDQASLIAARHDSADLACDEAEARLQIDDVAGAIRAAERATRIAPEEVRPWFTLAQAHARHAPTVSRAAELLETAREQDPDDPRPYIGLLRLHDQRGPLPDAERLRDALRTLVNRAPHAPFVEGLRVQELIENNRFAEAIERMLRLIDRTPADNDALSTLIRTWLEQERGEDALAWIDARRAARPHDMTLFEQRVRVLLRLNRAEEVYHALSAQVDANADDYTTRRLLETVCYATERRDEAITLAEARLLSRPAGIRRDLDLVELYLVHERTEDAAKRLRPMVERFADSSEATIARIMRLVDGLPTIDPAYDDLRLRFVERYLARTASPDPRAFIMGMRSLLRLDGLGEKFDALAVATVSASVSGDGQGGAAAIRTIRDCVQGLLSAGEAEAAARLADIAFQSPQNWSREALGVLVQINLASHVAADQIDEAYSFLRILDESNRLALVMNTDGGGDRLGAAYYSLSVLCTIIGREEAAERLLISALERRPDDAMAMNNLGYRRIEEGVNTPENAAMIERALTLMPTNSNLLDTAGWLRYRQGRFAAENDSGPGAAELLELSLREAARAGESPSAEVWDHLGDTRWRLGSSEGAKEAWSRAERLLADPNEREQELQNFARYQMLGWGVLIESPEAIYDREFAPRLESVRRKLEALERGEAPPVAPTFAEAASN